MSDAIEGCDNNYINERIVSIGMSDCKSFIYFCTYIMYMFYLVGLGLFDEKDISLKGLECLRNVDKIYAEFFTSRLFGSSFEAIEELIGQKIEILVRGEVEEEHKFMDEAKTSDVALITGGDPLIATTHSDFLVQCSKKELILK